MTNRTPTAVSNVDSLSSIARAYVVAAVVAFVALNFAVSVEAQSDNDSPDTTPEGFTFINQTGVKRSTVIESNAITVSGIDADADISILGEGEYSINGGNYTASAGTVKNGNTVTVRHTSSSEFKKAVNTLLDIGGLAEIFASTTEEKDTTPAQFKFDDKTDVATNTEIRSNEITVSGINSPAPISVTGGEYSLDGGETFTGSPGTVPDDAKVMVRHTSSTDFSKGTNTTLDIGGVTDTFNSTTLGIDTTPEPFSFEAQEGVARSTLIESNTIEVTDINADATISSYASGDNEGSLFEFKINNGDWMGANGEKGAVENGDKVTVRHTSASGFSTIRNQGVQIGLSESAGGTGFTTGDFTTVTIDGNTVPEKFSFIDQTDVARSSEMISNTIKVSGIEVAADISVEGGEYSINGGDYTAIDGTVENGDAVTVRHTSSNGFSTPTNTTLTIDIKSETFTSTTLAEKTTPVAFSFVDQTDVPVLTERTSNAITVSGINSAALISVTGGEYSINGGSYTDSDGTVENGKTVTVRHTSSDSFSDSINTTLTIGGVKAEFTSTTEAEKATPDPFEFTDQTNVTRSTLIESNTITVSGINTAVAISVTAGDEYKINSGSYTAIDSTVKDGDTVTVRHTSSDSFSTPINTELTIGGVPATFTSTTEAEKATPVDFSFTDQTNVTRSTLMTSNTITVSGINTAVAISVTGTGGEYSINGGGYTANAGTVENGNTVTVRHTSSDSFSTPINTELTIGGVPATFTSTTEAEKATPVDFSFTDQTNVTRSTLMTSNTITVSGINTAVAISVTGTGGEYSINGGGYTANAGTVENGNTVTVRHTSSGSFSTPINTELTIGGVTKTFTSTTEAEKATPDAFAFAGQPNVTRSTLMTSDTITVSGINTAVAISVTGGEYSINGGSYTASAGTVEDDDEVTVRHTSSDSFSTPINTELTIGGVKAFFTSITLSENQEAADTTPDAFAFTGQPNVTRSTVMTSNTITVSGLNLPAPISVAGGEYSINGGDYTANAGTVEDDDEVTVRHTSSDSFSTPINTELTIGGVKATFTSITLAEKTTPDGFAFAGQPNVTRSTLMTSNKITVSGINTAVAISVTGGEYSINGGSYTASAGTVEDDDEVTVRHTSSDSFSTPINTELTIGGVKATFTSITVAAITTPDPFSFTDQTDVARLTVMTSNKITVSGIEAAAAISVAGGEYSINGGSYTASAGTVEDDDEVTVRHTSSDSFSTPINTELTIGGVKATFTSITLAEKTTPDGFAFAGQPNVTRSTLMTSNTITVSGINTAVAISVTGTGGEYSINGGGYTANAGTVENGNTVTVRHTSSGSFSTPINTELTIGGVKATFTSITLAEKTTPDGFAFAGQPNVTRSTLMTSNTITVSGINTAVAISVTGTGGEYSINGGGYTANAGTVENGNTVTVRHTSSDSFSTPINTELTIGGVKATFTSITLAAITTPDPFSFTDQTDVARSTLMTSNKITVSGINTAVAISVTGGEYSINGGSYTASAGTVEDDDEVTVRHTSSGSFSAATNTELNIGGVLDTFTSTTVTEKAIPNAFSFTDQTDVARSTEIISNTITVSGINTAVAISVTGGEYSINGGGYTANAGTVENGNTVTVRHTSSGSFSAATNTELAIGGMPDTFTSITLPEEGTADTTPQPFSFIDQTDVARSTVMTSNTITVSGISAAAAITVTSGEYSVNGGGYTANAGTVENGDAVTVRHTSSDSFSTVTNTELDIGGVTDTFSSTTVGESTTPDAFSFTDQTDVARSTVITSNTITVSGINSAAAISVTGGEYSINSGGYTVNAGTVENGDTVTVRHTSSDSLSTATNTTLTIDRVNDIFSSITLSAKDDEEVATPTPTPVPMTNPGLLGLTLLGLGAAGLRELRRRRNRGKTQLRQQ